MIQFLIIVGAALLVGIDQFTKYLALTYLQGHDAVVLIPKVLELDFLTNPGVAFGLFPNNKFIFIGVTSVTLLALAVVLLSGRVNAYKLALIGGTMVVGGGIGNLIDRVLYGEVVDFISVTAINFPVFNAADCFVVIGSGLLLIFFLFVYKEEPTFEPLLEAAEAGDLAVTDSVEEADISTQECIELSPASAEEGAEHEPVPADTLAGNDRGTVG